MKDTIFIKLPRHLNPDEWKDLLGVGETLGERVGAEFVFLEPGMEAQHVPDNAPMVAAVVRLAAAAERIADAMEREQADDVTDDEGEFGSVQYLNSR